MYSLRNSIRLVLLHCFLIHAMGAYFSNENRGKFVVSTWDFHDAVQGAWTTINASKTNAIDAVEVGCAICEANTNVQTVGYGGSPDENGETTLDAMIFDGKTHDVGSVGCLRRIKPAISVARHVMEHTGHTILVGDLATEFALQMGFKLSNLSTAKSLEMWTNWKAKHCQPNFWLGVNPDPSKSCGPYKPKVCVSNSLRSKYGISEDNHDTIGMIAMDGTNMAVGVSSNGATHKIPGRVGDAVFPGAGGYVENDIGAAVATGDGDVMMRFAPTRRAVDLLAQGKSPKDAATIVIQEIAAKFPDYYGAVLVASRDGDIGAACHKFSKFPYTYANKDMNKVVTVEIKCINS